MTKKINIFLLLNLLFSFIPIFFSILFSCSDPSFLFPKLKTVNRKLIFLYQKPKTNNEKPSYPYTCNPHLVFYILTRTSHLAPCNLSFHLVFSSSKNQKLITKNHIYILQLIFSPCIFPRPADQQTGRPADQLTISHNSLSKLLHHIINLLSLQIIKKR